MTANRILYSCVVDGSPRFAFQAWGLVHSLLRFGGVDPARILVHATESVDSTFLAEFSRLGVDVRPIARFGDGAYCNKIAQLSTHGLEDADGIFLLDADMVVLEPIEALFDPASIRGKVVDFPNPDIATLRELFCLAGFRTHPAVCPTDLTPDETFATNLNGGLYAIPRRFVESLSERWRHWASWLLEHAAPLRRANKSQHVDQVSFAMAAHELGIPVSPIERRYNCPIHHGGRVEGYPSVIHYHDRLSKVGLLDPRVDGDDDFARAIADANQLLGACFDNRLFWSFRYQAFPELGSGIGSRGENLAYKRRLLASLGLERSRSILDVGCGDLEVLKDFKLHGYTGIDVSPEALRIARAKRPELNFLLATSPDDERIPEADTVLCLEVLIHQQSAEAYARLIEMLALKARRRLIVSGYNVEPPGHGRNHMIRFHEPLLDSLRRTGRFSSVDVVGKHTDVDVVVARVGRSPLQGVASALRRAARTLRRLLPTA